MNQHYHHHYYGHEQETHPQSVRPTVAHLMLQDIQEKCHLQQQLQVYLHHRLEMGSRRMRAEMEAMLEEQRKVLSGFNYKLMVADCSDFSHRELQGRLTLLKGRYGTPRGQTGDSRDASKRFGFPESPPSPLSRQHPGWQKQSEAHAGHTHHADSHPHHGSMTGRKQFLGVQDIHSPTEIRKREARSKLTIITKHDSQPAAHDIRKHRPGDDDDDDDRQSDKNLLPSPVVRLLEQKMQETMQMKIDLSTRSFRGEGSRDRYESTEQFLEREMMPTNGTGAPVLRGQFLGTADIGTDDMQPYGDRVSMVVRSTSRTKGEHNRAVQDEYDLVPVRRPAPPGYRRSHLRRGSLQAMHRTDLLRGRHPATASSARHKQGRPPSAQIHNRTPLPERTIAAYSSVDSRPLKPFDPVRSLAMKRKQARRQAEKEAHHTSSSSSSVDKLADHYDDSVGRQESRHVLAGRLRNRKQQRPVPGRPTRSSALQRQPSSRSLSTEDDNTSSSSGSFSGGNRSSSSSSCSSGSSSGSRSGSSSSASQILESDSSHSEVASVAESDEFQVFDSNTPPPQAARRKEKSSGGGRDDGDTVADAAGALVPATKVMQNFHEEPDYNAIVGSNGMGSGHRESIPVNEQSHHVETLGLTSTDKDGAAETNDEQDLDEFLVDEEDDHDAQPGQEHDDKVFDIKLRTLKFDGGVQALPSARSRYQDDTEGDEYGGIVEDEHNNMLDDDDLGSGLG